MNPAQFANQVLERCASTNDLARSLGEAGYPHGTWVSARLQDAGRGRLGRRWEAEPGNLFLSVLLRISNAGLWTWVPLTGAVATAAAARELNPKLDIRIKWPNDLWLGGAKLGGLLAEASGTKDESFIVLGIGLNCVSAPQGLDQPTAALSDVLPAGARLDAEQVRQPILSSLLEMLARLESAGPGEVAARYREWAALPEGTPITWGESGAGTIAGLGGSGELRVIDHEGKPRALYAEDVKIRPALSPGSR